MRCTSKFLLPRLCAAISALSTFFPVFVHAQEASQPAIHGIAVANMDRSVKPGDDFYEYASGDWLKRTEIPPDRAVMGVFSALSDLSNQRTAALIDEIAKSNPR